jgi:hypothetical protein
MTGDTANRLVWHPAGVVHFHLKTYSTQREEWDKTFQKERATIQPRPVPTYNFATTSCIAHKLNPHILVSEDRAHSVIRLHSKYTKHRRDGNLFNPRWQTTSSCPGHTLIWGGPIFSVSGVDDDGGVVMRTSHLLIHPLHLQRNTYKDP